jgi:hypothetical protein
MCIALSIYILHTYHLRFIPERVVRYSFETPTFYKNDLGKKNTQTWSAHRRLSAVYLRSECRKSFEERSGAIPLLCPGYHMKQAIFFAFL